MLSPAAQKIITDYLHLPFSEKDIFCPYFINKKNKIRAALRALVGKGTPEEIVEETRMCALKERIDLTTLSSEEIKRFMVDHRIGIECSGLVYHVLDAEVKYRHKKSLGTHLYFPTASSLLRKLIIKLRPAENAHVLTFAHPKNSTPLPTHETKPGDVVILKDTGPTHSFQHILLIHQVDKLQHAPLALHYTHSIHLNEEDMFHHGVRQGTIIVTDESKPLIEQIWRERGKEQQENNFYTYAQSATSITIHRLHCLM